MASEAAFARALARILANPRPDPHALSVAVRSRFGRAAFAGQVSNMVKAYPAIQCRARRAGSCGGGLT
jgi:hypothetical protein